MNQWVKGSDVVERETEEAWMGIHNTVPEGSEQNHLKEKESQEGTVVIWRSFANKLRKGEKWKAREKGKDIPNWMQSSREEQGEIRRPS